MNVPEADREFEALLDYLKHSRGCDLTGYKRSTLMRRFVRRMQEIKIDSYGNYFHYLQSHPEECSALIESCLQRVKFYATDVDEAALLQARQGIYQLREVTEIPLHLLEKYFEQTEQGYVFLT
ncbi:MAG TPA: hypothetical protein DDZ80_20110 [Cyanobacteria bacterium UBA8803]|nr:hypothetical protein [Cyanobacteria bacterium UBA9273]HBL60663.1 hypothetical protein [Cyanobacteria bacterium UBA8803]